MIAKGTLVQLEYTLLGKNGDTLESSAEDGPMECNVGDGDLPATIEEALVGREKGDVFEITLQPEDAFGSYDPEGLVTVPRSEFPEDEQIDPGLFVELEINAEDGSAETLETRVIEVNPDAVVLDANHPLAGKVVTFRMRILEVGQSGDAQPDA